MKPEFDQYAAEYDKLLRDPIRDHFADNKEFFHLRKWKLLTQFFHEYKFQTEQAVWLDVGCGKGELLKIGRSAFARVAGCDPSAGMLDGCAGLDVVKQSSTTRLPFANESFDLVTAVCVYHHVDPSQRLALTLDIHRVLKPGGVLSIIEHNPFNPVTQLIVRRAAVDVDAKLLTARAAGDLVAAAGLMKLETTHFLYFPEAIYSRLGVVEEWLRRIPLGGQYCVFAAKPATS